MKRFKSLFIKDDEQAVDTKKETKSPQPISSFTPPASQNVPIDTSGVGTDWGAHIESVLHAANKPGPDYLEFDMTLQEYENKPLTELQKYEMAYTPFKIQKVTPEALVESGHHYLRTLETEKAHFDRDAEAERKSSVNDKLKEAEELDKKITEYTQRSQQLRLEATQASHQLNTQVTTFEAALAARHQIITSRISKIQTYLNATTTK